MIGFDCGEKGLNIKASPANFQTMATFPSPLERKVASALLLLSTQPSKLMIGCCDGETKGKTSILISSTESQSCSSSLTTHQLSSRKQQKLRIIAAAARCHDIKLKLINKRRSRTYRSYDNQKISSFRSLISSNIAKAGTTSSSSSSGISTARSQRKTDKAEKIQRMRRSGGPNYMRRRAEAILKLLSGGCFSEVNIRRVLGDSPDTSKALRMYTLCLSYSLLRVTTISHSRVCCKLIGCTEDQRTEVISSLGKILAVDHKALTKMISLQVVKA